MTSDPGTWLDRLLARHPEATLTGADSDRPAVIKADELLVAADDAPRVEDRARRWIDRSELVGDAGVARFWLRRESGAAPGELADDLRRLRRAERTARISPNHLMAGAPGVWDGGPADLAVPAAALPKPSAQADAVRQPIVAVIDTGISPHPWFTSAPWWAEVRNQDHETLDERPRDDRLDSQAGHGTFISGVVLRREPEAYILAPKLLASDGVCDELGAIRKLRRLARWSRRNDRPIDVVNLSFGGYTFDDRPPVLFSEALADLGTDTVVVACAGNDATSRPYWPAALDEVIAIGALDESGSYPAAFSNHGWWVDAWAVGERVTSTFVTFDGPAADERGADPDEFEGFARWSGTSFAAPQVAGAVAAIIAADGRSATDAIDALLNGEDVADGIRPA